MAQPFQSQRSLLFLLGVSFALYAGSILLDLAIRERGGGLYDIFIVISWIVVGLIPALIAYGLYRFFDWKRFRSSIIVSPAIITFILVVIGLIVNPPSVKKRFGTTLQSFPISIYDLQTEFSGLNDCYYFRCSSSDTEKVDSIAGPYSHKLRV